MALEHWITGTMLIAPGIRVLLEQLHPVRIEALGLLPRIRGTEDKGSRTGGAFSAVLGSGL